MTYIIAANSINIAANRIGTSWQWYVIRGAGFVSAGLLILLMISGIGQVTGIIYRFIDPLKVWAIHKTIAFALCGAIIIHVGFLLIDKFMPFSLLQILVPFASNYSNGTKLAGMALGSLAVTLGILAMYGVAVIVASSLGWIDSRKKLWRWLHYLSYIVMLFIFVHAVYAGSDLKYGTFRQAWILAGLIMALAILVRLWRVGVLKKPIKKAD